MSLFPFREKIVTKCAWSTCFPVLEDAVRKLHRLAAHILHTSGRCPSCLPRSAETRFDEDRMHTERGTAFPHVEFAIRACARDATLRCRKSGAFSELAQAPVTEKQRSRHSSARKLSECPTTGRIRRRTRLPTTHLRLCRIRHYAVKDIFPVFDELRPRARGDRKADGATYQ
jgi:hypothetical protein